VVTKEGQLLDKGLDQEQVKQVEAMPPLQAPDKDQALHNQEGAKLLGQAVELDQAPLKEEMPQQLAVVKDLVQHNLGMVAQLELEVAQVQVQLQGVMHRQVGQVQEVDLLVQVAEVLVVRVVTKDLHHLIVLLDSKDIVRTVHVKRRLSFQFHLLLEINVLTATI